MKKYQIIPTALFAVTLALAGCTTNPDSMSGMNHGSASSDASKANNSADTMFAQMMAVHHQQAVTMSDAVLGKLGVDPKVIDLAKRIKAAQGPEIEKMKSWLVVWGEPETMTGSMSMPGMMDESQLKALADASGADTGKLFLSQMIAHHEGAVESAKTEQAQGKSSEAKSLAASIISGQQAEIDEMKSLLATA